MFFRLRKLIMTPFLLILSACGLARCMPAPLDGPTLNALYATPLSAPDKPLTVYHMGHSLVAYEMPAMLTQLAGDGHSYNSQLGWGTPMKGHWTGEIHGFDVSNKHPQYRDAEEALTSGDYDTFVFTEMVEIEAAVEYFGSWDYTERWVARARAGHPDIRIYLYETWHWLDDPKGWLNRLDNDLGQYWEGEIIDRVMAMEDPPKPIYVIPAGKVFARFVRELEARGGVDNLTNREDLFATTDEGELDPVHVNDIGFYLVALTHYAVLYQKSPIGLPHQLLKADGTPAEAPGPKAARLMQEIVWDVVTSYPRTGVPQNP